MNRDNWIIISVLLMLFLLLGSLFYYEYDRGKDKKIEDNDTIKFDNNIKSKGVTIELLIPDINFDRGVKNG